MYEFSYHKASSIDDAKKLQSEAEEGKFMSGGMTLLPTLKMRLARPSDVVDRRALERRHEDLVDCASVPGARARRS